MSAGAAVLALFAASGFGGISREVAKGWEVSLKHGCVRVLYWDANTIVFHDPQTMRERKRWEIDWLGWVDRGLYFPNGARGTSLQSVAAPLWPIGLALLGWGEFSRRRSRRLMAGECVCGYNLAGLAAGTPCPECGRGQDASVGR